MGILKGGATIIESEETYVYSEDDDVRGVLPERLRGAGWIPSSLVPEAGRDADVVTVRAMDPEERNKSRNIGSRGEPADAALFVCSRTTVEIRTTDKAGKRIKLKKPSEIRDWYRALAQRNWPAVDLLFQVVTMMTIGEDVEHCHAIARRLLGYEDPSKPEPEEVADDGATKSGERAA